jgi:hypothetical protein
MRLNYIAVYPDRNPTLINLDTVTVAEGTLVTDFRASLIAGSRLKIWRETLSVAANEAALYTLSQDIGVFNEDELTSTLADQDWRSPSQMLVREVMHPLRPIETYFPTQPGKDLLHFIVAAHGE